MKNLLLTAIIIPNLVMASERPYEKAKEMIKKNKKDTEYVIEKIDKTIVKDEYSKALVVFYEGKIAAYEECIKCIDSIR